MQTYNELKTEYTRQVEMTEQALTRVQGFCGYYCSAWPWRESFTFGMKGGC